MLEKDATACECGGGPSESVFKHLVMGQEVEAVFQDSMEGRSQQLPLPTSNLFLILQDQPRPPDTHTPRPGSTTVSGFRNRPFALLSPPAWAADGYLSHSVHSRPQFLSLPLPHVQCIIYYFGFCHLNGLSLSPHYCAHCSNVDTPPPSISLTSPFF